MCLAHRKIIPSLLTITISLSNHDIPQQVGYSFGVFGEGMKVSGKNTLLPEGSLGVFSLP
jgi:hypothetical protein